MMKALVQISQRERRSFTLIELLIVVAIIGILAAIAVPNFLNAQIRAKVARAQSELRSIRTAFEQYHIDKGAYPFVNNAPTRFQWLIEPVAYLSFFPKDPFYSRTVNPQNASAYEQHADYYMAWETHPKWFRQTFPTWGGPTLDRALEHGAQYLLLSRGPDGEEYIAGQPDMIPYDSSNGVTSWGDIYLFGP